MKIEIQKHVRTEMLCLGIIWYSVLRIGERDNHHLRLENLSAHLQNISPLSLAPALSLAWLLVCELERPSEEICRVRPENQGDMAGIGPLRQDWEPIVVRKRAQNAADKKDEKAVNAARRSGAEIDTTKKYNAGTNKAASSGTSLNTKRLDDDTENLSHERVSSDLKKNLMQARLDKKMTQAQLAQMINEKPQVIQEYESGKAIPNNQIIGKLERALGAKLRSKK
uniref:HTH cro/C1-type domain-containing protein n=2 Tax=Hordeum vulgare subsp. vulgare TaxID=112509 RepID=A0A8I7B3J9_HORVV